MDITDRCRIDAARRAEIFHETYADEIDAGDTLAELVETTGSYLSRIIGEESADNGMAVAIQPLLEAAAEELSQAADWRKALRQSAAFCFSEWPLGQRLHDLAAYAIYGIVLDGSDDPDELASQIEAMVTEAQQFLAASPIELWRIGKEGRGEPELVRLIRLAANRWALDNGRPVEPRALAAFGGVSEGRVRNMMAGSNRQFSNEDGRIPANEALAWLATRAEFWNSIWREQRLPGYAAKNRPALERPVFVPVARDGTVFHPGLRRGTGYMIGEKGSEIQAADFETALAQLQAMPAPYWRRPNPQGNWGIVRGVRWVRLDESDLESFAADPQQKLPNELSA